MFRLCEASLEALGVVLQKLSLNGGVGSLKAANFVVQRCVFWSRAASVLIEWFRLTIPVFKASTPFQFHDSIPVLMECFLVWVVLQLRTSFSVSSLTLGFRPSTVCPNASLGKSIRRCERRSRTLAMSSTRSSLVMISTSGSGFTSSFLPNPRTVDTWGLFCNHLALGYWFLRV